VVDEGDVQHPGVAALRTGSDVDLASQEFGFGFWILAYVNDALHLGGESAPAEGAGYGNGLWLEHGWDFLSVLVRWKDGFWVYEFQVLGSRRAKTARSLLAKRQRLETTG
jgi:hypothetical protein